MKHIFEFETPNKLWQFIHVNIFVPNFIMEDDFLKERYCRQTSLILFVDGVFYLGQSHYFAKNFEVYAVGEKNIIKYLKNERG